MSYEMPSFTRNPERRRRRRRWLRLTGYSLIACVGFILAFIGSLAWQFITGVTDGGGDSGQRVEGGPAEGAAANPVTRQDQPMNILVLGTDAGIAGDGRRGPTRSDTLMLVSIDPLTEEVSILSIPRDTLVRIPVERLRPELRRHVKENPTKIAHTHAFGGPEVSMATVAEFLRVPVHRYVRVNLDAFVNIVDLMGGVDICVEKNMNYEDPYQDLYIHLRKGCQRLDGERALQYARYRQDSDLARIERQQKLVAALIQRGLSIGIVPKLPQIVRELTAQVETNLTEREILRLAGLATKLAPRYKEGELVAATIPGRDGWIPHRVGGGTARVYYWLPDEAGVRELVDRLVWRIQVSPENAVKVAVKNASGSAAAGQRFADYLRSYGYEVTEVAPAETSEQTQIFVHREALGGKLLARALSYEVETARVYAQPDAEAESDLTVVIGRDYYEQALGDGRSDVRAQKPST